MNSSTEAYSEPIPSRKIRFHQRRSAEERRKWVRRQERSGQSLKQFCEQHRLALSSFCLWRRQFAGAGRGKARREDAPLVEVPLRVPAQITASASVVIQLPEGTRIEASTGTDVVWLAQLVRRMRRMEEKD